MSNRENGRILFLFVWASWNLAHGCMCWPPPVCARVGTANAVIFTGKALNLAYTDPGDFSSAQRVRFQVERIYQGLPPDSRMVSVHSAAGSSCEQPFAPGTRYLVFAQADETGTTISERLRGIVRRWWHGAILVDANQCSGSIRIDEAAEEINFLEAWTTGATPTVLDGDVFLPANHIHSSTLSSATVISIGNDGQRHIGPVDELGRFRIAGVRPGLNQVTLQHPQFPAQPPHPVAVPTGGCSALRIGLRLNEPIQSSPKQ